LRQEIVDNFLNTRRKCARLHLPVTEIEPTGGRSGAPSRLAHFRRKRVTTTDPTNTGRIAAIRRPLAGAVFCACLFGASLPAFAQQAGGAVVAALPAATIAIAAAPAKAPQTQIAMQDSAVLLAADLNRLMGSTAVSRNANATADAGKATAGGRIQSVLKRALALLGTPYRWGGTTTAGFDCSGLVGYVFRTTLGIELPRVSRDMANSGEKIARSEMSPGDLVFFGHRGKVDHVGIYLGDGRFVHAPRTGRDVTVSELDGGYWGGKFVEARRVAGI
jgi:cell wall-associated NlpC family hydrolase